MEETETRSGTEGAGSRKRNRNAPSEKERSSVGEKRGTRIGGKRELRGEKSGKRGQEQNGSADLELRSATEGAGSGRRETRSWTERERKGKNAKKREAGNGAPEVEEMG